MHPASARGRPATTLMVSYPARGLARAVGTLKPSRFRADTKDREGLQRLAQGSGDSTTAADLFSEGDIVRVRNLALIVTVSAVVVALAAGASACASSGSSTLPDQVPPAAKSMSPAPASAFGLDANKHYGYSVRYPLGWLSASTKATASGDALVSTLWADPKGKVVSGHALDTLQVAVYAMTKPVKATDLVSHAGDFKGIVNSLIKDLPKLKVTDPFKPITVNGTKGFQVTYTYDAQNVEAGAMSYLLLPKGSYAYWITGQASADTWSASWSKLTPAMSSFTITPLKK
jgi:hypothetical protein